MIKLLGDWPHNDADRLGRGGYAEVFACNREGQSDAIKAFRDASYANTRDDNGGRL